MKKAIPYYRCSTKKQGTSGLGLEAQQAAVEAYAKANGFQLIPAPPYVEVESGKKSDRPKLAAALAHCRAARAILLVAKLDRLSRNVAFLSALMEAGVDFIACDNPHANKLTIHILAAVAQAEAEATSERTKAALAAYKARGGLLGASRPEGRNLSPKAAEKGRRLAHQASRAARVEAYAHLLPIVRHLRGEGRTLQEVADQLNADGYATRRNKPWNPKQVLRVLKGVQN